MSVSRWSVLCLAMGGLASCAPMSPEATAQYCEDRARAAIAPTGSLGIALGEGQASTRIGLAVSGDYLRGHDPGDVYRSCMNRWTGAAPGAPLRP